jgi:regulator of RNase E activity RraA
VVIRPGDFVFGDTDGVVIVPQEMTGRTNAGRAAARRFRSSGVRKVRLPLMS